MKTSLFILSIIVCFAFQINQDCGDGVLYANQEQTGNDKRFIEFQKIVDVPTFKGGDKKLAKIIQEKLKLSDIAKTQIFNLNYRFTVTCDQKIKDIKQIGDSKADDWTNIKEIIESTEGSWTAAKKDGVNVDCIYFGKIFIYGGDY